MKAINLSKVKYRVSNYYVFSDDAYRDTLLMEFPDNNGDTGYNEIDFKDNFFAIIQRDLDKNIHILEIVDPINFLK